MVGKISEYQTKTIIIGQIMAKQCCGSGSECFGPTGPWMKEEKGIIHRGGGAYLRCPVFNSVQFSLRNEGSSEYICLCEGRESLCPNFQTFQDPMHRFHGISRLVSGLLFRGLFIATYAGGNVSLEIFALLKSLKIRALENYVCLLRHTFTGS
jgi:hypothetical protein